MIANIRKEHNRHLVYFIGIRRVLWVNSLGAEAINYFFNKNYSISRTFELLNKKLTKQKKKKLKIRDFNNFFKSIKKELSKDYGGYPLLGKQNLKIPIAVELQINTQCNLRCEHCCQDQYQKIMSFTRIKKILKILKDNKVFEINIVGGEAFLHPNILDIIALCEKYNFAISVISNGTLLNESIIKKIAKFENVAFLLSLEGYKRINDQIRGNGVFYKVDKAIKLLKKYKIYTEISSTINRKNIKYCHELIQYTYNLDLPCNFNLFKPFSSKHSSLVITPEEYFNFILKIFKLRKNQKIKIGLTNAAIVSYLASKEARDECRATVVGLTVDVDGRMVPCPFLKLSHYYNVKKLPLLDKNFVKTWNKNKYFKNFRKRGLKECQACSYIFANDINANNPYGIYAFKKFLRLKSKNDFVKKH